MTGLEKIVKEIEDEARSEAAAAQDKARTEAAQILEAAKTNAAEERAKIEAATKQEVADIERGRESSKALQRRQRTLQTKQTVLDETLAKALDELYKLPDEQYFDLMAKLAVGAAQDGEGEVLMNEKDLARLPGSFERHLNKELADGKKLKVAKETLPIDGGFILKYGDIEENCSFAALFSARKDEFSDKIRGILFS